MIKSLNCNSNNWKRSEKTLLPTYLCIYLHTLTKEPSCKQSQTLFKPQQKLQKPSILQNLAIIPCTWASPVEVWRQWRWLWTALPAETVAGEADVPFGGRWRISCPQPIDSYWSMSCPKSLQSQLRVCFFISWSICIFYFFSFLSTLFDSRESVVKMKTFGFFLWILELCWLFRIKDERKLYCVINCAKYHYLLHLYPKLACRLCHLF